VNIKGLPKVNGSFFYMKVKICFLIK